MKIIFIAIWLAAASALAASNYEMEGGSLRRENRSLNSSPINGTVSLLWKQAQVGMGEPRQHPIILADRIVQHFTGGVACLSRQDGAILWKHSFGGIYNTPSFDPQRNLIYVCNQNGQLRALRSSDGSVAWSRPGGTTANDLASATYFNGRIYLGNGAGSMVCLDADTHLPVWSTLLQAASGITTPAIDDGKIFVATRGKKIFRLNLASGAIEWQKTIVALSELVSAITLGSDKGYFLTSESKIFAFDRSNGNIVWTYATLSWGFSNLSLAGNILLEATDDRRLRALNAQTGAVIWDTPVAGNFGRCAPLVACGVVFVSGCAGEYYGMDLRTGSVVWIFRHNVHNSFVDWAEADGELYTSDFKGTMYRFQSVTLGLPADCDLSHALSTPTPQATPKIQTGPCPVPLNPDMTLWLSANQGVDADSQGRVTRWNDLSGYGHHALAGDTMRPTKVLNGWGGRPVLRFDGIQNFMSVLHSGEGGLSGDHSGITVIAALKMFGPNSTTSILLSNSNGQANPVNLGRINSAWHFTPAFNGGTPDIGTFKVMSFRLNGSSGSFRRDGMPVALSASSPYVRSGNRGWVIGRNGSSGADFPFKGDLYALMVFKRALSDAEVMAYEQCLLLTPHTPTMTPSATKTATATNTPTRTPTSSPSSSQSPSESATPTASPSATQTATATDTSTQTPTASPSDTLTQSPSPSQSSTESPTSTASPIVTPTSTPTPTEILKSVPTEQPSPKPTRDRSCDAPLIDRVMITPNPSNAAADRMVSVKLGCGADEVKIEIYSVAGVRLFQWVDTSKHVVRGQWVHERYPHDVDLPNGTYFVRIYVTFEGRTESAMTTFMVLK